MNPPPFKVLGISGSPRKAATDLAVRMGLTYLQEKYAAETDYFTVRNQNIQFCIHCDYCVRKKIGCIHKDDLGPLYPKLIQADAWLVASPVYNGQMSGQLKTVFDRTRALLAKNLKVFENKVGAAIAVGGDRNGGQEQTLRGIIDFFIISEMIPVGGGPFGANIGGTVWSRDLKARGTREDTEGIKSVYKTIDRMVRVAAFSKQS